MMNKKSGKRVLSWLLAAAMLIALMPANALAEPPTESGGSTETTVEFRCPDSEGSAEVSVGDYDSSTTAEALFKDVSSDVLSFDADSAEDSLKEGTIEGTDTPVRLDKAVVLEDGNVPETQEELEKEGTEISAVVKTENDIAYLPATGGKPVDLGEDQTLVIIYTPEEETTSDADNGDEVTADGIASLIAPLPIDVYSSSYPVYVYGRFMNGKEHLGDGTKITKNGKEQKISWNGDAEKDSDTSHYITFGSIKDATTVDPNGNSTGSVSKNDVVNKLTTNSYTAYTGKGNASANGFKIADVSDWDLHTSSGAVGFTETDDNSGIFSLYHGGGPRPDGGNGGNGGNSGNSGNQPDNNGDLTWHMDGDIHVYKIIYKDGDTEYTNHKYYFGSYTVDNTVSVDNREGYTFKGWTLDGETVINRIDDLKAVGGTATTVTLKAKWEKDSYPIYVYGYIVNGDGTVSSSLSKGSKIIKDNGEAKPFSTNGYGYGNYITFGKIGDATTVKPVDSATTPETFTNTELQAMLAKLGATSTDKQNNGFSWTDVAESDWDLHTSKGATDYGDEVTTAVYTWHMDGKINVYGIKYLDDVNGNDISANYGVDTDAFYYGTYRIPNNVPVRAGYTFEGWDVNGTAHKPGDNLTLKDFGTAATITLTAQWKEITNPVYVYGYFKHNAGQLTGNNIVVNGKKITWNEDEDINEYFITFGKIEKGTPEIPTTINATSENFDEKNLNNLISFTGRGNATDNKVKWTDVTEWDALKVRPGAASYNDTDDIKDKPTWHLDGKINVYTVNYAEGGTNVADMPETPNGFFFGNYTLSKKEPTRKGYTFEGWDFDGTTYEAGATISLNKDTVLTAKWEPSTVTVTFEVVGGTWDGKDAAPQNKTFTLEDGSYKLKATSDVPWGMQPDADHTNKGAWYDAQGNEVSFSNTVITEDTTFTYRFEEIKYNEKATVTFKVVNGTLTGSDDTEKNVTVTLTKGKGTLHATDIPAMTPTVGYKATGDWDVKPNTEKNAVTEDVTYTFTFDKEDVFYTVIYTWGSDAPAGAEVPEDSTQYPSNMVKFIKADTTYRSGQMIEDTDYIWTFNGWSAPVVDDTARTVTFTGTWRCDTKAPQPTGTADVTFKIEGGEWNHFATSDVLTDADKVTDVALYGEPATGKLSQAHLPCGMTPKAGYTTEGAWYAEDGTKLSDLDNGLVGTIITGNVTFIYKFNKTEKLVDALNSMVQKSFTARYNRSTEGTFTATAVVSAMRSYEIQAIVTEREPIGTYKGEVTLKTGETKPFIFTDDGNEIRLETNTTYEVKVSEDTTQPMSKVDYDTTEYTLTFTTDANGVVTVAGITPDNGTTETDNGKITFHNIYTYKRHHSSDDGGNGGKKDENPTVEITDDDALGLNDTDHFAYIVGYGNGEVRPQNSITRAEVAAIFFRLLEDDVRDANYTRQNKFTDVSNDAWYCSAVSTLSAMGIISGYPDATFRPNASITRAEFAAIATRFDVNGDKTPVSFSDIAGHWAKDEIAVAANNGWVNGYEDGSFRPQNKITRAETMSLVNRVLNRRPETAEDLLENMTKWTDNADTNAWYYLAVQEATNSHYYEYKENSQYEKWTELRETRDWSELDK